MMGSSAGAYSAMGAVDRVTSTFTAATDFAVVAEGGVGVGRAAFEASATDTIKAYDGTNTGKPLVRFGHVTFSADATQRSFAPPQYQTPAAFSAEARRIMQARALASAANFRYFVPAGTCHTFLQSPGLYQQFSIDGNMPRPVQPRVSPNPDLLVDDVPYVSWLKGVVTSSDPFERLPNPASWDATEKPCPLPGGRAL